MDVLFSIIVPTRNRRALLEQTLAGLEQQRDAPPFEIIVVDDGSTDDTVRWMTERRFTRPARLLTQPAAGPAHARNTGVRAATGTWVGFLGDDTVPDPNWLTAHRRAHRERGDGASLAVIGYTRWHPGLRKTRFMEFLNEKGLQFGFSLIQDPEDVPFNFFYASNLSVRRMVLGTEPFDVRFPAAAWEDIELGYRLKAAGMRIVYEPHALAFHYHPTSVASFLERCHQVGRSAVLFQRLHPALGSFLGFSDETPPKLSPRPASWALKAIAFGLEDWPITLPFLWWYLSRSYYALGCHEALRDRSISGPYP